MILRNITNGVTVQVPDTFDGHHDRTYWGVLGPHERQWPDGHVEQVEWRTTVLTRSQWEKVSD
jgi:hypothetical protein